MVIPGRVSSVALHVAGPGKKKWQESFKTKDKNIVHIINFKLMKEVYSLRNKLAYSIYPYILSASELKKTTDYTIYHLYNFGKEIVTALAGVGIGTTINDFLNQGGLPPSLTVVGIPATIAFGAVSFCRNRVGREDVIQKILGQKKIIRQFRIISNNVNQSILENNPTEALSKLTDIQQEAILLVNNAIRDGYWPYDGVKASVRNEAINQAATLIKTYHPDWNSLEGKEAGLIPDQTINK